MTMKLRDEEKLTNKQYALYRYMGYSHDEIVLRVELKDHYHHQLTDTMEYHTVLASNGIGITPTET